jgi:hypothetical protein
MIKQVRISVVYFQTNTGTTGWRQSYADRVVVISPERLVLQFLDKIFGLSYLYPTVATNWGYSY